MNNREVLIQTNIDDNLKDLHSRDYFGYGRWDSQYWFIGLEAGGDTKEKSIQSWIKMGMKNLVDCKSHHINMEIDKHHRDDNPATSPTWRKLIIILLSFKYGIKPSLKEIKDYQKTFWGSDSDIGETLVVNVSATPAKNRKTKAENRDRYREKRIVYLFEKIKENKPIFVIIYGKQQLKYWNEYINFDSDYNSKIGNTIIKGIKHPARNLNENDCVETGIFLRLKT